MVRFLLVVLVIPLGLDLFMPVPEDNPITAEKIELGRRLFNDRRLSRDNSIACSSCHDPERAFSAPEPVSPGVLGRRGRRNAPALINRGWGRSFFWDGRVARLEEQVAHPIEDRDEMDLPIEQAASRVGLSTRDLTGALATYVRSIMSGNAPYDRYIHGDRAALSAEEQSGLLVFRGRGNCTACHIGPSLTDERFHNTGIAWAEASRSFRDEGRAAVTGAAKDRGAFKTPTLREVARTAPYMHDGSITTLEDAIDYYDRGGNRHLLIDEEVRPLGMTPAEKRSLVAFLHALSGTVVR